MKGAFMKNLVFCCMILFVFIIGCEKTTSLGNDSKIYGTVLNPDGNPVGDAKILVNFNIDSEYPIEEKNKNSLIDSNNKYKGVDDPPWFETQLYSNFPNPFITITTISFSLGHSCKISLCIEDFDGNKIIDILDEDSLDANLSYVVWWDGKNDENQVIQNGPFKVLLLLEDKVYKDTLFIFKDYSEFSYEDIAPLSISDNSGKFTIRTDNLPLIYIGDQYDENGNPVGDFTVTPYIDIWAFHPEYAPVHIDSLLVESGKDMHVSLSFE